jgi:hypothetical protein
MTVAPVRDLTVLTRRSSGSMVDLDEHVKAMRQAISDFSTADDPGAAGRRAQGVLIYSTYVEDESMNV